MMKTITLPGATWNAICVSLDGTESAKDADHASMIREQLSGRLKVQATKGGMNVRLTAPKGGDLRGVIEAMAGVKVK